MKMIKLKNFLSKKNDGVTSTIVVLAVAVILTIIISGIAALSIREIRQSSNTELSNKALQTAEAGVKVASQYLNANPTYEKTSCATDDKTPTELIRPVTDPNQQITCITVQSNFLGTYESKLDQDKATQFFLGQAYTSESNTDANTPYYLNISWANRKYDNNSNPAFPLDEDLYPTSQSYIENGYAAAMEITIFSWPSSGMSGVNTEVATIFLMPGRADGGYSSASGRTQIMSNCNSTTDYICTTGNFNLFAALGKTYSTTATDNPKFSLRIKPRYANTHFKLEAYNKNNQDVNIFSSKAQIDVTARVGNLYRRIKADKEVIPLAVENVFDSVLFSGNNIDDSANVGICKNIITKKDLSGNFIEVVGDPGATKCN